MQTSTSWDVPNLKQAIATGFVPELETKSTIKNDVEKLKYRCDCGIFAWDFQFHDVRNIPGIESDFACDGCYTRLERNLDDIDGTGKPANKRAFNQKYLRLQNAPQAAIDKVGKKWDKDGEVIKIAVNKKEQKFAASAITYEEIAALSGIANATVTTFNPVTQVTLQLIAGQSAAVVDELVIEAT